MRFQMLKRDIRLFLRCLLPAVALTAAFAVVCAIAAVASVNYIQDAYEPAKVAVVDESETEFSGMLIRTVAGMDYIADLMELSYCDKDTAMDGLQSGELTAAIVLPEGVFDGIRSGSETKGQIYLSSNLSTHSDIIGSVASLGELLLASGQYALFSGRQLIREYKLEDPFWSEFRSTANPLLLSRAVGASTTYFDIRQLDYAGTGVTTTAYYAASWLVLLLMLSALFFAPLYAADTQRPILCRLRTLGIGDGQFLTGKLLLPAGFQCVISVALLWIVSSTIPLSIHTAAVICALGGVVLSAAVCGFFMMLGNRGVPIVAGTALVGLILCGGIIPRQMLPEALLTIGSFTPYGIVQSLILPIWGGPVSWTACVVGSLYLIAALIAMRTRLQWLRIGGDA